MYTNMSIDHFTVVCSVTWPLNGSEAGVDLPLIQTSLLLSCKCTQLALKQLDLHNKSRKVCIKTRLSPASLPFNCQVTEQTTVKWSIGQCTCSFHFNCHVLCCHLLICIHLVQHFNTRYYVKTLFDNLLTFESSHVTMLRTLLEIYYCTFQ